MSERFAVHNTFVIEKVYNATPALVFETWADPKLKEQWFSKPDTSWASCLRTYKHGPNGVYYPNLSEFVEIGLKRIVLRVEAIYEKLNVRRTQRGGVEL